MTEFVGLATFPQSATAYEAFSRLKTTPGMGVGATAVVERDETGRLQVRESADVDAGAGTSTGVLIGMLVGVLGGPLGMLLGMGAGALSGSLVDLDRADTADDVLSEFGRQLPDRGTALVVQTEESETDALDAFVGELGGSVLRRPVAEVLSELEAQQQAAEAAAKAARDAAKEQKKHERQERHQERIDALKAKFGQTG